MFLYFRMLLIMVVTLYTSRIYLQVLGETDFGIYNIVGGVVVLLTFINTSLTSSIQRFLNYEMGKGRNEDVAKVFSCSLLIYIVFSIVVIILGESFGLWFLNTQMNIPSDRMVAVNWVYQFTLLGFIANMMRVPYNAIIMAKERMNFYAYFSILEAALKLGVALLLIWWGNVDRLILLSILTTVVFILITNCYKFYCNRHFVESHFHYIWAPIRFKQILSFSGWSLLGSTANMGATQGVNLILNIFYGVVVNAAVGIATQLVSGVQQLVNNFQLAFNPQLVKLYAAGEYQDFLKLIFRSSKFSFYLMLIISIPIFVCMEFVLNIWLTEVPQYTEDFCRLILIFSLIDSLSAPLWLSVQAVGKIRNYQMLMSSIIILSLPLSYIALKHGYSPLSVWIIRVVINIITHFARLFYLEGLINMPVMTYMKKVMFPATLVTTLSFPLPFMLNDSYCTGWANLLIVTLCSTAVMSVLAYYIGFDKGERMFFVNFVKCRLKR